MNEKIKNSALLSAADLSVGYGNTPLLKEIAMDIRPGDILGVIGPNGAGKTTLLKSLIRQMRTLGGTVYVEGEELEKVSGEDLAKKIAVVLTERPKTELMSVWDVVSSGRYPYTGRFGILSEEDELSVNRAMELTAVTELKERDFAHISDGQKQRVMLARAICQETDIIVLDEPTSFLDIKYKIEFATILQKMARERKVAILITLHELDLAQRLCTKVMCIGDGRLERYGSSEDIFSKGYVEELFRMEEGSFDCVRGSLELKRPDGEPKVFVAAGGGHASHVFRMLQREGTPFIAGILPENDLDYPVAKALAAEVISCKMFESPSGDELQKAKERMAKCERILVPEELLLSEGYPRFWEGREYEVI